MRLLELTTEQWQTDIQYLQQQIEAIHPAPFHRTAQNQLVAAFNQLQQNAPQLRADQIIAELTRLAALVGDAHTSLVHWISDLPTVPLWFDQFEEGIFVILAGRETAAFLGAQLTHINDQPIEMLCEQLLPLIATDNESFAQLILPEYLRYLPLVTAFLDGPDSVVYGFAGENGRLLSYSVPEQGTPKVEEQLRLRPTGATQPWQYRYPEKNYWFDYLDRHKAVYLHYRNCYEYSEYADNEPVGESAAQFAARLQAFVQRQPVEKLIIDMRHNTGGDSFHNLPLLKVIIGLPLSQQSGRLFALTDRATFSAAGHFIYQLENYTAATFVGEPPGASPSFYSDPQLIRLPESNLPFRICTSYWQMSHPFDGRQTIQPDLPFSRQIADYKQGNDPALEAILAHEGAVKPPVYALIRQAIEEGQDLPTWFDQQDALSDVQHIAPTTYSRLRTMVRKLWVAEQYEQVVPLLEFLARTFPAWAVSDFLGEAYLKVGNEAAAKEAFEHSLTIFPKNQNAIEKLKKLSYSTRRP